MNLHPITSKDLATRTRDVVHRVRQGQPAVVHSAGEDQVVLLDALDYRLLHGVAAWVTRPASGRGAGSAEDRVMRAYLDQEVSLGKAAELLGISRFDLQARFMRLDIPLRQGPMDEAEIQAEIETAKELAAKAS